MNLQLNKMVNVAFCPLPSLYLLLLVSYLLFCTYRILYFTYYILCPARKTIRHLEFNLGGHKWLAGFSGEHFSDLTLEKVVIKNASSVEGDWFSGDVFNSSVNTLTEFLMDPSSSPVQNKLNTGAFSGLKKLSVVKLGKINK